MAFPEKDLLWEQSAWVLHGQFSPFRVNLSTGKRNPGFRTFRNLDQIQKMEKPSQVEEHEG